MTIINIAVGRSKYQINCPDGGESKVQKLAAKLNERVNRLALAIRGVDEKTLLLISALAIEDEIENLKSNNQIQVQTQNHTQIDDHNIAANINEFLSDEILQIIEEITAEIENLSNKIKNN